MWCVCTWYVHGVCVLDVCVYVVCVYVVCAWCVCVHGVCVYMVCVCVHGVCVCVVCVSGVGGVRGACVNHVSAPPPPHTSIRHSQEGRD